MNAYEIVYYDENNVPKERIVISDKLDNAISALGITKDKVINTRIISNK